VVSTNKLNNLSTSIARMVGLFMDPDDHGKHDIHDRYDVVTPTDASNFTFFIQECRYVLLFFCIFYPILSTRVSTLTQLVKASNNEWTVNLLQKNPCWMPSLLAKTIS
jgi:hypothetical protein